MGSLVTYLRRLHRREDDSSLHQAPATTMLRCRKSTAAVLFTWLHEKNGSGSGSSSTGAKNPIANRLAPQNRGRRHARFRKRFQHRLAACVRLTGPVSHSLTG